MKYASGDAPSRKDNVESASHDEHDNRLANPQWTAFWPLSDRNLRIADEIRRVAEEVDCTPSQAALSWFRGKNVIPIVGARNTRQFVENLGSVNLTLPEEHVKRLERV